MVAHSLTGDSADAGILNIYLLPGIGLSVNYFDSLSFPSSCKVKTIALLQPVKEEPVSAYAGRLMQNVEAGIPFVLIGMSFGGVLAQEMAAIRKPEAIILLSTIQHSNELPWYFRLGNKAGLTRIVPYQLVSRVIGLVRRVAGKENRILYDNQTATAKYLSWSLHKMLNWQPVAVSVPCYQIHGAGDRLLPCRYKNDMFVIAGASHLLLPGRCGEVNRITSRILSTIPVSP